MKRVIFPILLMAMSVMFLMSCGKQNNKFVIDGTCSPEIPDSLYLVFVSDENFQFSETPIDTIWVNDKKFSWSTESFSDVRFINLVAIFKESQQRGLAIDFALAPGESANLKVCNGYYEIGGSKFYEEFHAIQDSITTRRDTLMSMQQKMQVMQQNGMGDIFQMMMPLFQQLVVEYQMFPKKYMAEHPDQEGDVAFLALGGYPLKDSVDVVSSKVRNGRMKSLIDKMIEKQVREEESREMYEKQMEQQMADVLAKTAEGQMFTDFEAEYDGKIQKLSDYVGKGKYVLVDFWASWCGPCRQEIPNIINVYNKYKGAKFDVVGVAVGDDPDDTKQAIADDKIPYNQILNTGDVAASAYGIRGIPHIILFAPDGTILKRDLRGPQIEAAVKEALGK